jgi:hypothetical protein
MLYHYLQSMSAGCAMAQAVSRWSLTAEARVRSQVNPCGICVGKSGTGTCFSPSTLVFPCQFYFTGAPVHGKTDVVSAAGTSPKQNKKYVGKLFQFLCNAYYLQ